MRDVNIISDLVDTVTRLVMQKLMEGERADYRGGRGRYESAALRQVGSRDGYQLDRCVPPRAPSRSRCRRARGTGEPSRSSFMRVLNGNSEMLER